METKQAVKIILILLACLTGRTVSIAQTFASADSSFAKAKTEVKPVLLMFTGSDWCTSCIRFDKKIMQDAAFKDYSDKHLTLVIADFPQQKKQPAAVTKQNDSLAALYNADGVFPKFVLLDANAHSNAQQVIYSTQSAIEFIDDVKKRLISFHND